MPCAAGGGKASATTRRKSQRFLEKVAVHSVLSCAEFAAIVTVSNGVCSHFISCAGSKDVSAYPWTRTKWMDRAGTPRQLTGFTLEALTVSCCQTDGPLPLRAGFDAVDFDNVIGKSCLNPANPALGG
jgi:hypothetical protein